MVNVAPFPMMLITLDYTLDDLVVSALLQLVSVLTLLGNFDVMITTYRHLLLHPQRNPGGKSPVMIRPMFIHKDFSAYPGPVEAN